MPSPSCSWVVSRCSTRPRASPPAGARLCRPLAFPILVPRIGSLRQRSSACAPRRAPPDPCPSQLRWGTPKSGLTQSPIPIAYSDQVPWGSSALQDSRCPITPNPSLYVKGSVRLLLETSSSCTAPGSGDSPCVRLGSTSPSPRLVAGTQPALGSLGSHVRSQKVTDADLHHSAPGLHRRVTDTFSNVIFCTCPESRKETRTWLR
jgi:hypothetical protein